MPAARAPTKGNPRCKKAKDLQRKRPPDPKAEDDVPVVSGGPVAVGRAEVPQIGAPGTTA